MYEAVNELTAKSFPFYSFIGGRIKLKDMDRDEQELNKWINYKQRFYWMYGKNVFNHYNGDADAVRTLRYEIIYL